MKTKTVYVVQYNDCYGNGDDKKLEVVVKTIKDFKSWLREHNVQRVLSGESIEHAEEFTLIPLNMILTPHYF